MARSKSNNPTQITPRKAAVFCEWLGGKNALTKSEALLGELFIDSNMHLFFQRPQVVALLFLIVVIWLAG